MSRPVTYEKRPDNKGSIAVVDTSHHTIHPARLKHYAYSQIQDLNKTSKLVAGLCTILGARHQLASSTSFEQAVQISLKLGDSHLILLADRNFVQEIGCAHFDLPADYVIPEGLQCASVENVLSPFLHQLENALNITIAIEDVRLADVDSLNGQFDYYAISHPDHRDFNVALSLVSDLPDIPLPLYPVDDTMTITFPIVLDEMSLSLNQIEDLEIGDIFLSQISRTATTLDCRLPLAGHWLGAAIEDNKLLFKQMDIQMTNEENQSQPAPTPDDQDSTTADGQDASVEEGNPVAAQKIVDEQTLGDAEIKVRFDLGELSMALKDVQNLVEGSVVELPQSFDQLVRISINGTPVGQAELIDIDGKAGVRILRLNR